MESLQGKHALSIDAAELQTRLTGYEHILIDLGTGDGRFVEHVAHAHSDRFVIGLDACRENLRKASRRAPCNALYLIANALALPADLQNLATEVTINFPWGSLLEGLLAGEAALLEGLAALARPGAHLAVRLNGGALAEAGWSLPDGAAQVQRMLRTNGFTIDKPVELEAAALRQLPTTWARRLAFGRDPRAVLLSGKRIRSGQLAAPPSLKAAQADGNLRRRAHGQLQRQQVDHHDCHVSMLLRMNRASICRSVGGNIKVHAHSARFGAGHCDASASQRRTGGERVRRPIAGDESGAGRGEEAHCEQCHHRRREDRRR